MIEKNTIEKVQAAFRMLVICMANGISYEDSYRSVISAYRLSYCDAQALSEYTDDLFALNYANKTLSSTEEDAQTNEWFEERRKLIKIRDYSIQSLEMVMKVSPFTKFGDSIGVLRALSSVLPDYL